MRGKITHIKRSQQVSDFSGLLLSHNITPTDIDGLIEYHNEKYVFFEVKYMNRELPYGQRLALERLVNDTALANKASVAIVCEHDEHDVNKQVDVANTVVREYYGYKVKKWIKPPRRILTHTLIELFISL